MSSVQASSQTQVSQSQAQVRAAIAGAARATGVDFNYLLAQARLESNLDPDAAAATSSARGLYQFVGSTWLETMDRHGAEHGLGWAGEAIGRANGRASVADPAMRSAILRLRHDPAVSSIMAAELARDNNAQLQGALGRAPDGPELYLAHFLGSDGAARFLTALEADPARSAAGLFPRPAAANRAIFYESAGDARSLGEVMQMLRERFARAGENGEQPSWPPQWAQGPGGAAPAAPPALPGGGNPAGRPSMAEVLRTTFLADGAPMPGGAADRVRDAYGRLRSFGL